ncbi:MAG: IS256 family transposase [Pseudomonadota bacterium]
MARRKQKVRSAAEEAVLDELLKHGDIKTTGDLESAFGDLKKALVERILNAEMNVHLDSEDEQGTGNHRNGSSPKTVLTDGNERLVLDIPRDRQGRFDPALIAKYQRRFPGFDDKIISMYAAGMSTRSIQEHILEMYSVEISPALVSAITDAVLDEVKAWRNRPLEHTYALVYFDALRVKIRDEGAVRNKAVYLAIGVTCAGRKEVLGMWIEQTEGAKFWMRVMTDLRDRGTQDILIAIVDGLKGFPDAITGVFPETVAQTCIVHLIRYSMHFASWKERKQVAAALRSVYSAPSAEAATEALDAFEQGEWGQKYPAIVQSWRRRWEEVIPFFAFSSEVRKIMYTTNAIESLKSRVRRAIRNKGHFPNDTAATKLIYLALKRIESKWKRAPKEWHAAKAQLAIQFGDRSIVEE